MSFETRGLSCGYSGHALVKDINMKVAAGEVDAGGGGFPIIEAAAGVYRRGTGG